MSKRNSELYIVGTPLNPYNPTQHPVHRKYLGLINCIEHQLYRLLLTLINNL